MDSVYFDGELISKTFQEKLDKDQTFWIIQKNSIWFELMNNHVLRCNQVKTFYLVNPALLGN